MLLIIKTVIKTCSFTLNRNACCMLLEIKIIKKWPSNILSFHWKWTKKMGNEYAPISLVIQILGMSGASYIATLYFTPRLVMNPLVELSWPCIHMYSILMYFMKITRQSFMLSNEQPDYDLPSFIYGFQILWQDQWIRISPSTGLMQGFRNWRRVPSERRD